MIRAHTHRMGFSLLELSVVLGIISLVAAAGISLASGALKAADRVGTQERLNTIKLALDSYAKTYGYLPCPADRAKVTTDATFGVETRPALGTTCTVNAPGIVSVTAGAAYIGGVPVRTLGLPDNYAGDSWGNKLTYAVSADHVKDAFSYANLDGRVTVNYGDRSGTHYPVTSQRNTAAYTGAASASGAVQLTGVANTTGITATAPATIVQVAGTSLYSGSYTVSAVTASTITLAGSTYTATDTGTVTWQAPGPAASYVVVSHGPDGRGAFPMVGTSVPSLKLCIAVAANSSPPPCNTSSITSCNDIENCDNNDINFYDTAYNDSPSNPAQYFDDYVVWGSNAGARTAVSASAYPACNPGSCETWCAKCEANFPGNFDSTVAVTSRINAPVLCSKVLYSNSTTCSASCFWSGTVIATGRYQRCP